MIKTIKRLIFDTNLQTGPQMQSFALQTSQQRTVFTTIIEASQFLMFVTVNIPEMQLCMRRGWDGVTVKQNKM